MLRLKLLLAAASAHSLDHVRVQNSSTPDLKSQLQLQQPKLIVSSCQKARSNTLFC